jgi:hypothetical protein
VRQKGLLLQSASNPSPNPVPLLVSSPPAPLRVPWRPEPSRPAAPRLELQILQALSPSNAASTSCRRRNGLRKQRRLIVAVAGLPFGPSSGHATTDTCWPDHNGPLPEHEVQPMIHLCPLGLLILRNKIINWLKGFSHFMRVYTRHTVLFPGSVVNCAI